MALLGNEADITKMGLNQAMGRDELAAAQARLDLAQNKRNVGAPYAKNGRMYRDVEDAQGNIISTEDLGKVDRVGDKTIVKMPDGSYKNVDRDNIPEGAVPLSEYPGYLNQPQNINVGEDLAKFKDWATNPEYNSGKNKLTEVQRDAYMNLFNQNSSTEQIVKTDADTGAAWNPFDNKPATYTVVPKGSQQVTPSGSVRVKSPDGKLGSIPANQLDEALKAGYIKVD